jgi:predicted PurR-regulated permease PerM
MSNDSPATRFMVVIAAFIIIVSGMRASEAILIPFLLSLFIAVICSSPLAWMKHRGIPNALSLLIIIFVIMVVWLVFAAVVGSSVNDFRDDFPLYKERLQFLTHEVRTYLDAHGIEIPSDVWQDILDPSKALSFVGNMLSSIGNVMADAFFIILTVIFILAEEVRFSDKVRVAINSGTGTDAIKEFVTSINRYMAIKAALSLLTGGLVIIWLSILGVDFPVMWGMVAFMLNFIPNLGSILAAVPAVLLAVIQLSTGEAMLTALGYIVINVVVGNVMEPRIMGRGLDLSTLVVFLSLVFWGWVLGPIGMLLSVPLTMTLKIALESFEDTRWIAVFLGSGKDVASELSLRD